MDVLLDTSASILATKWLLLPIDGAELRAMRWNSYSTQGFCYRNIDEDFFHALIQDVEINSL